MNENTGSNDDVPVPEFARQSHHPSAVAMACTLSNLELLYLLIDTGASVDLADEDGETPLLIAIRNQFTEGARVLITQGHANVNLPEKVNGWTPLIVAGKTSGSESFMQGINTHVTFVILSNGRVL